MQGKDTLAAHVTWPLPGFVNAMTVAQVASLIGTYLPLPQALQCCVFPALLPKLKCQFARRGKVSPTLLSLGSHVPPVSFQATYKHQLIQHTPSEPGDRLLSAPIWFGT